MVYGMTLELGEKMRVILLWTESLMKKLLSLFLSHLQ